MTARVLVVDDVVANVRLLEAKLAREYFDVLTAMDGPEALAAVEREIPDIILLDVMMPGMDGFEVCRRIKADPRFMHIPVVMVTALSDSSDRVQGLEAGADDFLTKPVNDVALFARVRSLVRLKMMMDELRLRQQTANSLGLSESVEPEIDISGGHVLLVEDREVYAKSVNDTLAGEHNLVVAKSGDEAVAVARGGQFELIIVSLALQDIDALRLCSQLRSMDETRQVPLLVLVDDTPDEMARMVKGLDLGVNDYLIRPIDRNELLARARSQIRRKRYEDRLRSNYELSMTMAVTDTVTGLYNRRYMELHLQRLVERSSHGGHPVCLQILDIDHFKAVNDTHGHGVGDEVLREFGERIARGTRGIDMASRYGGEEFVIVMPDTVMDDALAAAERLRESVANTPFKVSGEVGELSVTVSIGVAETTGGMTNPDSLIRAADQALYVAKNNGRNRVVSAPSGDAPLAAGQGGS